MGLYCMRPDRRAVGWMLWGQAGCVITRQHIYSVL